MPTKLIPYEPIHAMAIINEKIRQHDLWLTEVPGCEDMPFKWAEHPAYTLVVNDEIILCGGVMLLDWQVGDAWTLFADNFKRYPIACFKACKYVIDTIAKDHNLRRVQAIVLPGLNGGRNFVERLGFQEEGLLRSFGPNGEDHLMFSKIIGEL
jgi:hypothetical protein